MRTSEEIWTKMRLSLLGLESLAFWGLGLLTASALTAQQDGSSEAEGSETQAPDIEPLLPQEGLLRSETWVELGRRTLENTVDYLPRMVGALIVLAAFYLLSRIGARLMRGLLKRTSSDPALVEIVTKIVRYGVLVLGAIMAISQAGIAVGPLLASVSVLGLAVGLAAQDGLSNLVAGLTILWDRPFKIGDRVSVADTYGEVASISIRTTIIRTLEQRELIIPNSEVIDGVIVNHSRTPDLRLSIPIGIGYGEDPREAREALLAVAADHPQVDQERESTVVVTELADSSVNLELRVWLKDPKTERPTLFDLLEQSKLALDEAGIEIPFPQRVLHLETADGLEKVQDATAAQPVEPAS